jgi:hypothetical protein
MLSEANVKAVRPNCAKLHAYVMEHSKDKLAFLAKVNQDYFKGGFGTLMLNIEFSIVYNLMLMVDYCTKVHMDLQADKSPVVVKGPFFPRVVNPRYRICGTMCNARIQSSKARKTIY